jgi:hypothetical protein
MSAVLHLILQPPTRVGTVLDIARAHRTMVFEAVRAWSVVGDGRTARVM